VGSLIYAARQALAYVMVHFQQQVLVLGYQMLLGGVTGQDLYLLAEMLKKRCRFFHGTQLS